MTAEQYRIENSNYKISDGDNIENLMQEYAKLKCKELLEIISEKAEENFNHTFGYSFDDKDFILYAVDLDKFIV